MENKDKIAIEAMRVEWKGIKKDILFYGMTDCMDEEYFDEYFDKTLVPGYTASHIHFHNMTHAYNVLKAAMEFSVLSGVNKTCLKLGAVFHDVGYVPGSDDNEYVSSLEFEKFAEKIGMPRPITHLIKKLIMATTHKEKYLSWIEEEMCDADLKELATDRYKSNSVLIRKEFSYLTDEEWRQGRMKFLKEMLDKPNVFRTEQFVKAYEQKAQANLKAEYQYLKNLRK